MKYFGIFLLSTLVFLSGGTAQALVPERAQAAFDIGHFALAAQSARRAATAEGYAFAARSALVYADFLAPPEDRLEIVLRAEEDARRAIVLAPDMAEGRLQLAIALGFRSRLEGSMSAHFDGLADEARIHLNYVVTHQPDNPWAQALLGGWHLEIVTMGGFVGSALYGASAEEGLTYYRTALTLQPGDVVITAQCALQLAVLGGDENQVHARALLNALKVPQVPNALYMLTLARARQLQAALEQGDEKEIDLVVQIQKGKPEEAAQPPRLRHQARPSIGLPR